MALQRISIYNAIKGTSLYKVVNGEVQQKPCAIDCQITPPSIAFETSTAQVMGSMTIPDQSRISDMTMGLSVSLNVQTITLAGRGYQEYVARWVEEVTEPSGAVRVVPFACYFSGYVTEVPQSAKAPGEGGTEDYSVALNAYRVLEGDKELYHINRTGGKLIINGEDYRAEVDDLL
ncbi:MAG: phage major tail tube protein [Bradymonadales bacterium]